MVELIYDITRMAKDFKISKVKLFVPANYPLYSLAAASALSMYLNDVCKLTTTLVADQSKVDKVSLCLPLVEDGNTIPVRSNDFIAVVLDCPNLDICNDPSWNKTFITYEIRGEVCMKDFGVNAYNIKEALCAAEIIFNSINEHMQEFNTSCPQALDYLYLALLDATSNLYLHLRQNTFDVIQELIIMGAEVNIEDKCFQKKDTDELKILKKIYTENIIDGRVAYMVIPRTKEIEKMPSSVFINVLEYIRYLKTIDIWMAFVENSKGGYTVFIQGSPSGKFDISRMSKVFKGSGSKKKGRLRIEKKNMYEVIDLAKSYVDSSQVKREKHAQEKAERKKKALE